jgi:hypothetical protein
MSEGFSGGVPSQPPVYTPPRRGGIPTWLIIVIIVLVLCILVVGIVLCVLPALGVALLGPAAEGFVTETFATLACTIENPNLDQDACTEWASNLSEDYPDALGACQSIISSSENSADTASDYYNCLIDEGVPPPQ